MYETPRLFSGGSLTFSKGFDKFEESFNSSVGKYPSTRRL